LFEPPPVERQMKAAFAYFWQKVVESASPEAVTVSSSQLRKHSIIPVDSNGAHTSANASGHSPGIAQQSLSASHRCVQ
jgi:hypothetical protein